MKTRKSLLTLITAMALIMSTTDTIIAQPTQIEAKVIKQKIHKSKKSKRIARKYKKKHHKKANNKVKSNINFDIPDDFDIHHNLPYQKAISNYDVPKITKFTKSDLANYHLEGFRYAKTTITYNINSNFSSHDRDLVKQTINDINKLGIVNLVYQSKEPTITISNTNQSNSNDADQTGYCETPSESYIGNKRQYVFKNNLSAVLTQTGDNNIYILTSKIKQDATNYDLAVKATIAHEIGHALGLDHTASSTNSTMAPYSGIGYNNQNTNYITTDYINSLATLYQN
ncbi:matrixin family metalloprotease [Lactobacillus sp. ESL0785]|uniref:matrixin family metalloprotease n=1 Tax=Lactobacillus sp. ESL0785 TaxID=2983232 RepID=UPI0023F98CB5|nr:matrixin family metalloprotease [Lactobacillus sp. ESL0785]WEV70891.1 matrixin family metalloprotease [Lactobacillus sp. ESL0785]